MAKSRPRGFNRTVWPDPGRQGEGGNEKRKAGPRPRKLEGQVSWRKLPSPCPPAAGTPKEGALCSVSTPAARGSSHPSLAQGSSSLASGGGKEGEKPRGRKRRKGCVCDMHTRGRGVCVFGGGVGNDQKVQSVSTGQHFCNPPSQTILSKSLGGGAGGGDRKRAVGLILQAKYKI